jgi:hypothetical protein
VKYRPIKNAAIFLKTYDNEGRSHTREGGQKKKIKKVNMVDILLIQE